MPQLLPANLSIGNFYTNLGVWDRAGKYHRLAVIPDSVPWSGGDAAIAAAFRNEADFLLGEMGLYRIGDWTRVDPDGVWEWTANLRSFED